MGRQQQAGRFGREAHEGSTGDGGNQPPTPTTQLAGRSSGTRSEQQGENDSEQGGPVAPHAGANDAAGGEPSDDSGGDRGGREDECLGLFAEAFADDLDLLRKDPTFTGSSKNVAAMADMMR